MSCYSSECSLALSPEVFIPPASAQSVSLDRPFSVLLGRFRPGRKVPFTNCGLISLPPLHFYLLYIQILSIQAIAHSFPRRPPHNPLLINHLRTLFIATGVDPLSLHHGSCLPQAAPARGHSSPITAVPSFVFILLRTLLHFFALAQNSTLLFSSDSALFGKNTRGWGALLSPRAPRFAKREGGKFQAGLKSGPTHASRTQSRRVPAALGWPARG